MTNLSALVLALSAFAAPSLAAQAAKLPPVMSGWDECKWNDPLHQTPKYVVGRIMAGAKASPNGIKAILPAINAFYPGSVHTNSSGMDKVDIPCVGVLDVVVNSGGKEDMDGGDSWAWQVVEDKCGACKPNRCEEVSKSKSCEGVTPPGGDAGSPIHSIKAGSGGGVQVGNGGRTVVVGGGGESHGDGGHPDQKEVVAQAKADLEAAGADLTGPCGAFKIVKLAAFRMGGGAGLLSKPNGNNCEGHSTDYVVYPDGQHYDILVDAGNTNGPSWQPSGPVDPARWREATDPGEP